MELLPIFAGVAGLILYWFVSAWLRTRRARAIYYAWRAVADEYGLEVQPSNRLDAPVVRGNVDGTTLEIRPSSEERPTNTRQNDTRHTTFVADVGGHVPEDLALESIDRVGPALVDHSEGDALGLHPDVGVPTHRSIGDFYRVADDSADPAPLGNGPSGEALIDLAEAVSAVEIDGSTLTARVDTYMQDADRMSEVVDRIVAAGRAVRDAYEPATPRSF